MERRLQRGRAVRVLARASAIGLSRSVRDPAGRGARVPARPGNLPDRPAGVARPVARALLAPRTRPLRIRQRHDAEERAMTTEHIAAAMERVQTVAAAPARDGPARRRARDCALARRHARRRRPRATAPRCRPTCRPSSAAAATRSRPAGCSAPGSRRARRRRIALAAAAAGIELDAPRGARHAAAPTRAACSAWPTTDGEPVGAGPRDVQLLGADRRARRRARAAARAGRGRLPLLAGPERGRSARRRSTLRIDVDAG